MLTFSNINFPEGLLLILMKNHIPLPSLQDFMWPKGVNLSNPILICLLAFIGATDRFCVALLLLLVALGSF